MKTSIHILKFIGKHTGIKLFLFCLPAIILSSCYSFNGGTTGNAKTASVALFKNEALNVNPSLAQVLTDKLKDKLIRETKLQLVSDTADMQFSATITSYTTSTAAVTGDVSVKTRLTIRVTVKFVNRTDKKKNFETSIEAYSDYDANKTLAEVESAVVEDAGTKLIQEIFNRALNNW